MIIRQIWLRLRQGLPNTLLVTCGAAIAGLISGLILARTLGPEGRGQYAVIVLWPTMLALLSEIGLGLAIAYYAGKNREYISGLWTLAWLVSLLFGGVAWLAGAVILSPQLNISDFASVAFRWNLFTVPVMLLSGNLAYLLLGAGYLVEFNIVRACSAACYTLGIAGVALVGGSGIKAFTAVFILAQSATCVLAIIFNIIRLHPQWCWQPQLLKPVFSYGLKTYISSLIAQANLRIDQMIMTVVVSPIQLGLYVVAVSAAGLVNPLYTAVAIVVLPRVTQAPDRLIGGKIAIRHLQIILAGGIPITIALCITMPWLLPLFFGNDYQLSILPAQVLLLAGFFQGCVIVLGNSLRGLGCPGKTTLSEAIGLITTIVLLYALLPIWGILGAAIASLLAYGVVALVQTGFLVRVTGIRWPFLLRAQ